METEVSRVITEQVIGEISAFAVSKPSHQDPWIKRCLAYPEVDRFLTRMSQHKLLFAKHVFADAAAKAFVQALVPAQNDLVRPTAKASAKLKRAAFALADTLAATPAIPSEARSASFRAGLLSLQMQESGDPSLISGKGDVRRRVFFRKFAFELAFAFDNYSNEVVATIASMLWVNADASKVAKELDKDSILLQVREVRTEIAEREQREHLAKNQTEAAIGRASKISPQTFPLGHESQVRDIHDALQLVDDKEKRSAAFLALAGLAQKLPASE